MKTCFLIFEVLLFDSETLIKHILCYEIQRWVRTFCLLCGSLLSRSKMIRYPQTGNVYYYPWCLQDVALCWELGLLSISTKAMRLPIVISVLTDDIHDNSCHSYYLSLSEFCLLGLWLCNFRNLCSKIVNTFLIIYYISFSIKFTNLLSLIFLTWFSRLTSLLIQFLFQFNIIVSLTILESWTVFYLISLQFIFEKVYFIIYIISFNQPQHSTFPLIHFFIYTHSLSYYFLTCVPFFAL